MSTAELALPTKHTRIAEAQARLDRAAADRNEAAKALQRAVRYFWQEHTALMKVLNEESGRT